ncbi:MAG: T9SS type A sorting domain-containing protein [Bacteroidota bacterium]
MPLNPKQLLLLISLSILFHANVFSQLDTVRTFIFGHSLIVHDPPAIPTPSNETTVPHWMQELVDEAGTWQAMSGQYGFLPQHANLPPISQWGFDIVNPAWDSDTEPFTDANFTHIMFTAGNFVQYQAAHIPYAGGNGIQSPLTASLDIIDWVNLQEDSLRIYVYENWPDMAGFLNNGFPPTAAELTNYYNYTNGAFHDWWLDYQDSLLLARPAAEVRMIPVGPILSGLLTQTPFDQIPILDLYEDDAPHGRPTLYFLAGLINYMAFYNQPAPASYVVPASVHSTVQNNYTAAVNYIWQELQAFNDNTGKSRVFYDMLLPLELISIQALVEDDAVYVNWEVDRFQNEDVFSVERSVDGNNWHLLKTAAPAPSGRYTVADTRPFSGTSWYRIRQEDNNGRVSHSRMVAVFVGENALNIRIYPNPAKSFVVLDGDFSSHVEVKLVDVLGRTMQPEIEASNNRLRLLTSGFPVGVYEIQLFDPVHANTFTQKVILLD